MISHAPDELTHHAEQLKEAGLKKLYAAPKSADFIAQAAGLRLDFSQNFVNQTTLDLFQQYYANVDFDAQRNKLISGDIINPTENRPALHTALRGALFDASVIHSEEIITEFARCCEWADALHDGPITDVVNLGIGGSDLGPRMAATALADFSQKGIHCHYVSNVDHDALADVLAQLNPATTLFIIASKSFTTEETLCNAERAKQWLKTTLGGNYNQHLCAVTSQPQKAHNWGVEEGSIFAFWDWVGGRYSMWSAIGLPLIVEFGAAAFREFLRGAYDLDEHFKSAPLEHNMPQILGMLDVWYANYFNGHALAVIPYSHRLRLLPAYLQQLNMESNGKQVDLDGKTADYQTGSIVWGTAGTDGQHSYHQLLHQGTHCIPVDFILPLNTDKARDADLRMTSHCLAQKQTLLEGASLEEDALSSHKNLPGNRSANLLTMDKLDPYSLGALIALYEHRTFCAATLLRINPFDQWGVERGKINSATIKQQLEAAMNNGTSMADAVKQIRF